MVEHEAMLLYKPPMHAQGSKAPLVVRSLIYVSWRFRRFVVGLGRFAIPYRLERSALQGNLQVRHGNENRIMRR